MKRHPLPQLKSIQTRIVLWGGFAVLLMVVTLNSYSILTLNSNMLEAGNMEVQAAAESQAQLIDVEIEKGLNTARTLAQSLSAMKTQGVQLERAQVNAMLKQVLVDNPDFLGVYTLWEPNAFDGKDNEYVNAQGHDETGRFIPYWVRSNGQIIQEPLLDYEVEGIGDYYLIPRRTGQETVLDPFLYPIDGQDVLLTSLVIPIMVDGKFYGITGVDLPLTFLQGIADKLDLYDRSAVMVLFSNNGTLSAVTGKPELVNSPIQDFSEDWEEDLEIIQKGEEMAEEEDGVMEVYVPVWLGKTSTPWSLNLNIPVSVITAKATKNTRQMAAIGFFLTVLAISILWFISGALAKPIKRITQIANQIAEGDLHQNMDIHQQDEVGQLASAFQRMVGYFQDLSSTARQIAEGDLTRDVTLLSNQDELGISFTRMIANLRALIGEIIQSAAELNTASAQLSTTADQSGQGAGQIAVTIQQIAQGTSQQSESVNRAVASVSQMGRVIDGVTRGAQDQNQAVSRAAQITTEINDVIQKVSANVQAGAQGADTTAQAARAGTRTVEATIAGMQTIKTKVELAARKVSEMGKRSEQIDSIVETIDDIASQTNLLALNAAIEAARVDTKGEKTIEHLLQQHLLGVVNLVTDFLAAGRELHSDELAQLAKLAQVDVVCLSNADGVIVDSNDAASIGFRFSEDPRSESFVFRSLLDRKEGVVIQPIVKRDQDGTSFVYVAISRRDCPGIVEAGVAADIVYRLGGYSRGFAVVSDEIRKLAEHAKTATKEIAVLIREVQKTVTEAVTVMADGTRDVENGSTRAREAGESLATILQAAEAVQHQVGEIAEAVQQVNASSGKLAEVMTKVGAVVAQNAAAAEQMTASSDEVKRSMENIASVSEENSAAVEEVSASAEEMNAQAQEVTASAQSLAEMAQSLQNIVAQFKLSDT
ncbi:MAG TPA: methyl-accepting chemotaxis protein [Anaerolineales bacterium]|nr:methyl-accepting chemotaxis protein [Anaerolineales bacterium]